MVLSEEAQSILEAHQDELEDFLSHHQHPTYDDLSGLVKNFINFDSYHSLGNFIKGDELEAQIILPILLVLFEDHKIKLEWYIQSTTFGMYRIELVADGIPLFEYEIIVDVEKAIKDLRIDTLEKVLSAILKEAKWLAIENKQDLDIAVLNKLKPEDHNKEYGWNIYALIEEIRGEEVD